MVSAEGARREWARTMLARCSGPMVEYGSAGWCAMPDGPAKVAAVVRAAERYTVGLEMDEIQRDAELAAAAAQLAAAEDARWLARRREHREVFDGKAGRFRPDPQIKADVEREWAEWVAGGAA